MYQEELPIYWRSGVKALQIRLGRYGWAWSGQFTLQSESQVTLRMRNEYDNTVYFIQCDVVKRGPRVIVILRGGDGVAPYRIENHTYNHTLHTSLIL